MASRLWKQQVYHLIPNLTIITGSFAPSGTSSPTTVLPSTNAGFTVERTGVGQFTITLSDSYPLLISAQVSLQLNSADDKIIQLGAIDVTSTKTIIMQVLDNAAGTITASDISANANNRIHFLLILKNANY